MVLATTAFGNELEDRTLGYLALTPAPRWWIALSKFSAGFLVAGPLLVLSGVAATLIGLQGDLRAAAAVAVSLLAGTLAYNAIFIWAGLIAARALYFALVYVFLWEGVLSTFLGGIRYLSVRGYTLAILHGIDGEAFRSLGPRVIEFPAALVGTGAVTLCFVWLTVRRLRRMDIP
jgi:ABC-2 type transport system permease protein